VASVYVFRAELAGHPGVVRVVALREDQTLDDLHQVFRGEFGWDDPHLYSFWLSGRIWNQPETEFTSPDGIEDSDARSAVVALDSLGLEQGQGIAYLFDFGDEWEVAVTVAEIREADYGDYPRVLEREGEAPPQYVYDDE
jgi:hypothetical protein